MEGSVRLQSLLWPEPGLATERDLFFRLDGPAGFTMSARELRFQVGGIARFDTYNNLFNVGKWVKYCGLDQLSLELEGMGQFELSVFLLRPHRSRERVLTEFVSLEAGRPSAFDIRAEGGFINRGLLVFELKAMGEGCLREASWTTLQQPLRHPDLMLSITTFRREDAVRATVDRFIRFIAQTSIAEHLHLTVVDNGHTVEVATGPHVNVIQNENLGGSGGFARGLIEAQARGATHCLFMDDDASVHMGAIERTWVFLAYATDPRTTVAGAVANAQERWKLWENGALFDHLCRPQHMGTDLRDIEEVAEMEYESTATQPHNFYGGWWYFAFPVDHVRHMPFPFFVRGDDVSFSLAHDFRIVTLPGVISYQDEDFTAKETPLTVYLDLRSHLAHHLALPSMEVGRKGLAKIMGRFWIRSVLDLHYETLTAVALALEDLLRGPEYFRTHADLAERRKQIAEATIAERWSSDRDENRPRVRKWLPSDFYLSRLFMKLTLNGHLLPGFTLIGDRLVLPSSKRGMRRPIWGAVQITYVTEDGKQSYTVRHNKLRAAQASGRILRAGFRILRRYPSLVSEWRAGYDSLTRKDFWQDRLNLSDHPDR